MYWYVLIQEIDTIRDTDGGIRHWMGDTPKIIEQYQQGKYRLSLIEDIGTWGVEYRLGKWLAMNQTNLIAWERVS